MKLVKIGIAEDILDCFFRTTAFFTGSKYLQHWWLALRSPPPQQSATSEVELGGGGGGDGDGGRRSGGVGMRLGGSRGEGTSEGLLKMDECLMAERGGVVMTSHNPQKKRLGS